MNRQMPEGYPKQMVHPHYQPAKVTKIGEGRAAYYEGTAVRFPPVTVYGPDGEEYHKAQGYQVK